MAAVDLRHGKTGLSIVMCHRPQDSEIISAALDEWWCYLNQAHILGLANPHRQMDGTENITSSAKAGGKELNTYFCVAWLI